MSSPRRRRPRSPAVKTPLQDDDLLGEILLRLPPQPSSLPRAALVCKRWRSLASEPGFFRRFRRHHRRSPPLLGFFIRYEGHPFVPTLEAPNRVPPGRFSLQPGGGDRFRSLGCRHGLAPNRVPPGRFYLQRGDGDRFRSLGGRHGLVLIFNITQNQMLVWDPVTGDRHPLAIPPGIATYAEKTSINGAVLRVGDAHFQVILTEVDNEDKQHRRAVACIYSSETGLWGDLISTPVPSKVYTGYFGDLPTLVYAGKPAVLAGNSIYWMLTGDFMGILEFDLGKQSLDVIRVPCGQRVVALVYSSSQAAASNCGRGRLIVMVLLHGRWEEPLNWIRYFPWSYGKYQRKY